MSTIITRALINIITLYFILFYIQNIQKHRLIISINVTILSSIITYILWIQYKIIKNKNTYITELNNIIGILYLSINKQKSYDKEEYTKIEMNY